MQDTQKYLRAAATGLLLALLLFAVSDAFRRPGRRGPRLRSEPTRGPGPGVGEPAPDFALRGLDGKDYRLTAQRGRVVVINFWATWCGPCAAEMPLLARLYEKHSAQGLEVLAVSIDDDLAAFSEFPLAASLPFPILHDTTDVRSRYGVGPIPDTLVVDRAGQVRYRRVGFGPTSAEELEATLRELFPTSAHAAQPASAPRIVCPSAAISSRVGPAAGGGG